MSLAGSQYGTLPDRLRFWARQAVPTHAKAALTEAADELERLGYSDPDASAEKSLSPMSPRLNWQYG